MLKTAFLNDTSEWYHWGCTATSQAIKIKLAEKSSSVDSIPINEFYGLNSLPQSLDDFDSVEFFEKFCSSNAAVIEPIARADRVFANGEGTLHGVKPVTVGLLYVLYAAKRFLCKPFSIINHSCYPESSLNVTPGGVAELLYRKVYAEAAHVAVRELNSFELVRSLGLSPVLSFDCLPLWVRNNFQGTVDVSGERIVLAGSVSHGLNTILAYAELIRVLSEAGAEVVVLTGAKAFPAMDDNRFVNLLKEHSREGWKLMEACSLEEWLGCIASSQLLVSGRFHHTLAAISLGVPYVVLGSNTPKIEGIMKMLDGGEVLSHSDPDLLVRMVHACEQRFGRRSDPEELLGELCKLAEFNFLPLDYE